VGLLQRRASPLEAVRSIRPKGPACGLKLSQPASQPVGLCHFPDYQLPKGSVGLYAVGRACNFGLQGAVRQPCKKSYVLCCLGGRLVVGWDLSFIPQPSCLHQARTKGGSPGPKNPTRRLSGKRPIFGSFTGPAGRPTSAGIESRCAAVQKPKSRAYTSM
jgi:hypothetical protein